MSFFKQRSGRSSSPLAQLLELDRVVMIGPILQEILIGIRRKEQASWVAAQLEGTQWIDLEREDWILATDLGREILKRGHVLPAADLQIAAVALKGDFAVWTTDPHFDLLPDLRRFESRN